MVAFLYVGRGSNSEVCPLGKVHKSGHAILCALTFASHRNRQIKKEIILKTIGTYISHKWGNPSDGVVSELIPRLENIPHIKIYLDKETIGYGESIDAFMQNLREGMIVVVVISEQYLYSLDCMHEMCGLFKNNDNRDRIFPVLVNSSIRDESTYLSIYRYWESQITICRQSMVDNINNDAFVIAKQKEIDKINEIIGCLPMVYHYFKTVNVPCVEQMRNEDYSSFIAAISKRSKDLLNQNRPQLRITIQIPISFQDTFRELLENFKVDFSLVNTKGFDGEKESDVPSFVLCDSAVSINAVLYHLLSDIGDDNVLNIHYLSSKHQLEFSSESILQILNTIKYE